MLSLHLIVGEGGYLFESHVDFRVIHTEVSISPDYGAVEGSTDEFLGHYTLVEGLGIFDIIERVNIDSRGTLEEESNVCFQATV